MLILVGNGLVVLMSVIFLWKGSSWLIEGASKIAARFGLSDFIIGLTIIALGTSTPEFVVSIKAALSNVENISLGNVVGSSIFNLGIILGSAAIIHPIVATKKLVHREGALLGVATVFLLVFSLNFDALISFNPDILNLTGVISPLEGLLMFALLLSYLAYLLLKGEAFNEEEKHFEKARKRDYFFFVFGLCLTLLGGHFLVDSVSEIARMMGISNWIISLTVVAMGTSAPEAATTIMAVSKKRTGMAIGNLFGSDIFNILGVLGVASILSGGLLVSPGIYINILLMPVALMILIIFLRSGWKLSRTNGAILAFFGILRWYLDFL